MTQTQDAVSSAVEAGASNVKLIYILYLGSFLVGITGVIGVVMAYLNRGSAPAWAVSHYTYQIRTFWIGFLYAVVAGVLVMAAIGVLLVPLVMIWWIVRCVKGLQLAGRSEPVPEPATWLF